MNVFKVDLSKMDSYCTLEPDDEFYKHSHGIISRSEYTICGVACEEWGYNKILPRKKITCPDCLDVIRECKTYKL